MTTRLSVERFRLLLIQANYTTIPPIISATLIKLMQMQGRDKAYAHKNVVVEFLFFVVHDKKKKERNHVPRSL